MMKILLLKNWEGVDIFRQTPDGSKIWEDVVFTDNPQEPCSHCVVLNYLNRDTSVFCSPDNTWLLLQEPPNEYFSLRHIGHQIYRHVLTTDTKRTTLRYIHDQPAIPWMIYKTYDELKAISSIKKTRVISWITSTKSSFLGHKKRMRFFSMVKSSGLPIDIVATSDYHHEPDETLFSEGYTRVVPGKWEGLSDYHYSIVIENFSGQDYWSEKLADCFLSWTVPIYYGCTNLDAYFPKDSYISIDISSEESIKDVQRCISIPPSKKQINALSQARQLILEKYQLFPFLVRHISSRYPVKGKSIPKQVVLPGENTLSWRIKSGMSSLMYRYL